MFKAIDDFLIDRVFHPVAYTINRVTGWGSLYVAATIFFLGVLSAYAWSVFAQRSAFLQDAKEFVALGFCGILFYRGIRLLWLAHDEQRRGIKYVGFRDWGPYIFCRLLVVILTAMTTAEAVLFYLTPGLEVEHWVKAFALTQILWFVGEYILACETLPPRSGREKEWKFVPVHS